MSYETVFIFQPEKVGINLNALPGFMFALMSYLIYKNPKITNHKLITRYIQQIKKVSLNFTYFSIFITLIVFITSNISQNKIIKKFNNKEFKIVEGKVDNFHPMPYSGHQIESFTVENVKFQYSDYIPSIGFYNTKSHGGPIHAGLQVRITYIDNLIVKLEIIKAPNKALNTNM